MVCAIGEEREFHATLTHMTHFIHNIYTYIPQVYLLEWLVLANDLLVRAIWVGRGKSHGTFTNMAHFTHNRYIYHGCAYAVPYRTHQGVASHFQILLDSSHSYTHTHTHTHICAHTLTHTNTHIRTRTHATIRYFAQERHGPDSGSAILTDSMTGAPCSP